MYAVFWDFYFGQMSCKSFLKLQVVIISLDAFQVFCEARINTRSPLSNGCTTACSKTSVSIPHSSVGILETSQRVKAIRRFIRGCVSLRLEQFRLLLFIVLRRGMKRLICQSLYSNIGKDLALRGPRTIVTVENSDFVYCWYNEHYEQVEKTPNENY